MLERKVQSMSGNRVEMIREFNRRRTPRIHELRVNDAYGSHARELRDLRAHSQAVAATDEVSQGRRCVARRTQTVERSIDTVYFRDVEQLADDAEEGVDEVVQCLEGGV